MRRILLSLLSVGVVAAAAFGATTAFFTDTETSTGNTLAAGSIDLKVDNTCYYNGLACIAGFWGGNKESGPCDCNWTLENLDEKERLFFEITDTKPGDWEEDTISLHVFDNDAWLCADVHLDSDDDVTCTEPEVDDDPSCTEPGLGTGDLADEIRFLWWADDGDNVLEDDETPLPSGPLGVLSVSQTATVAIADSHGSIFSDLSIDPLTLGALIGSHNYFLGKAWCFGNISPVPRPEGDYPAGPAADNDGDHDIDSFDGGFDCSGAAVIDNAAQSDALTVDIGFRAVQARNNLDFVCSTPGP